MEFYEVVNRRRTIRDFENAEIASSTIERIIEAGLKAPTNDHMRDWQYIVVRDKNTVMRLLDLVPKSFSEDEMDQLIRDWNLNDKEQQD